MPHTASESVTPRWTNATRFYILCHTAVTEYHYRETDMQQLQESTKYFTTLIQNTTCKIFASPELSQRSTVPQKDAQICKQTG